MPRQQPPGAGEPSPGGFLPACGVSRGTALQATRRAGALWRELALRALRDGRWLDAGAWEERALEAEHRAALLYRDLAGARAEEPG
jgi:hypothetical protein